jgi:hypothetical protein
MWKSRALAICGAMAALPLLGCAGGVTATSMQPPAAPAYAEYQPPPYAPPPHLDRTSAAPAAVLVVLPGAGAWGADAALWATEGFDVVTPSSSAFNRLAAEQEQALAQMMAAAERMAAAPVWVMGPPPEIEAALAASRSGEEQISGIIETSAGGPAATCTESFSYFDPGNGAKPQMKVEKSGDCPPSAGFRIGGPAIAPFPPATPMVPMAPAIRPNQPRVIEAAATPATASPAAHRAEIERLAELIKAAPSS